MTRSVIQIRVSEEEKLLIRASAAEHGLSVSEWVRQSALTRRPVHPAVRAEGFTPAKEDFDEALRRGREAFTVENLERQLDPPPESLGRYVKVGDPPLFVCPMQGCEFVARSPKARCPVHGRTVR